MKKPDPYPARDLGDLPVALVNAALGTELVPGLVRLSRQAHRHMARDHAADYPDCLAALPLAVTAPTFIGQAPGRPLAPGPAPAARAALKDGRPGGVRRAFRCPSRMQSRIAWPARSRLVTRPEPGAWGSRSHLCGHPRMYRGPV